jgi:predicted TIM-barrel enzyme
MTMASEAMGSDPSAIARHDAALIVETAARKPVPPVADAALAIGYEAADPALHAPQWAEAMQSASHSRR